VSIVIPAFNEARRLPAFLDQVAAFCATSTRTYEIIVVDDGSRDNTLQVAESYKDRLPGLRVIPVHPNRGKGRAVKTGLLESAGEVCLFMDADGSVHPEEIEKNLHVLQEDGFDLFIGSRILKSTDQVLSIRWYRKGIGIVFAFLTQKFLLREIRDTQCGFKMFRREVIRPLLAKTRLDGFGFDMEILYLASRMGYKIKEGPVSWKHVTGSKVNLFSDSIRMFINLWQIKKWHHLAG